jgi:molybdopterin converting factor small subunit
MARDGSGIITVEFFGPFREFGSKLEVPVSGPAGYRELLAKLETELGADFTSRAAKKNTTVIVNNRIASKKSLETLAVEPGDKVAFALLLGGG